MFMNFKFNDLNIEFICLIAMSIHYYQTNQSILEHILGGIWDFVVSLSHT